jgi:hypothetical protein
MTLIGAVLERGPFSAMLLRGWNLSTREPFRSQAFASQANSDGSDETCWTVAGKVRCRNGIRFPRVDD